MSIEFKRIKMELIRVQAAKAELEFKIDERLEDIRRIKEHIQVQDNKIVEIETKINDYKE